MYECRSRWVKNWEKVSYHTQVLYLSFKFELAHFFAGLGEEKKITAISHIVKCLIIKHNGSEIIGAICGIKMHLSNFNLTI